MKKKPYTKDLQKNGLQQPKKPHLFKQVFLKSINDEDTIHISQF